jgi:hypothetical protein
VLTQDQDTSIGLLKKTSHPLYYSWTLIENISIQPNSSNYVPQKLELLDAQPTQLWTGNGYHFIQPQFAIVLEKAERFKKFGHPSRDFMRFEEQLLTDNKADQSHSNNVSFGNCMLRIPGSLNSNQIRFNDKGEIVDGEGDIPPEAEVRVIQHWVNRPSIKPLLPQYYIWLQDAVTSDIDKQIEEVQNARKYRKYSKYNKQWGNNTNTIGWIEKLLQKPLDDFRKYCIIFILTPYLINIKRLSHSEAFTCLSQWLSKCDSVHKLNFNTTQKINEALGMIGSYLPKSRHRLNDQFYVLYTRLEKEGIVY